MDPIQEKEELNNEVKLDSSNIYLQHEQNIKARKGIKPILARTSTEGSKFSKRTHSAQTFVLTPERDDLTKPNKRINIDIANGNFHNYYTCRNQGLAEDPRLDQIDPSWITGLKVLDIGCNSGRITTHLGYNFKPKKIIGIDIDEVLIKKAKSHLRFHYSLHQPDSSEKFPISMPLLFGALPISDCWGKEFPNNVRFECCDITDQSSLPRSNGKFDCVLALSVTKWIHLNGGDSAIKKFFKKVGQLLAPGGKFILEPQPWDSYGRRAKTSETSKYNYPNIRFFPKNFEAYLLETVGLELLIKPDAPKATTISGKLPNGNRFARPIYVFKKPTSK